MSEDNPDHQGIAGYLASFYWQLTGTINQDIPLDANGTPVEFNRYVGYFLDKRPEFQGAWRPTLETLAETIYLQAIHSGEEPRKAVRAASRRAAAVSRRTSGLTGSVPAEPGWASERDLADLRLLEHGDLIASQITIPTLAGNWREKADQLIAERLPAAPASVLERRMDFLRGAMNSTGRWLHLLLQSPLGALRVLIREIMAAPRLVPTSWFLVTNVALYVLIMTRGIGDVNGWAQALVLIGSQLAFIWFADIFTYALHLDRDGWGDSPETRAFQDHHDFPDEVALWTVRRSVGTVGHGILILLILIAWTQPHFALATGSATALMTFLFATQSHRWAHTPADQVPTWAATLQRLRLFLPIEEHAKNLDHLDRSWGICNGWSNPLLDAIDYREKHIWIRTRLLGSGRPLWESQREMRGITA